MERIVFLNGKFIPAPEARIAVDEPAFLYGWGLFESMRSWRGNIVYLDAHLKRIKNACVPLALQFSYSPLELRKFIQKTVDRNCLKDAYVRLTFSKSARCTDTVIIARNYQAPALKKYQDGFCACVASYRQNENNPLARLKSANRLLYQLAYLSARGEGFDEALFLNSRGYLAEASRSNLFFAQGNDLVTPSLKCGCLEGITRKVILTLAKKYRIRVKEGEFSLADLYKAREAFLTNSLIGVMPLTKVQKKRIGKKGRPLTEFFMRQYGYLLYGNK